MNPRTIGLTIGALAFGGIVLLFAARTARDGVAVYHQLAIAQASLRVLPKESIVQRFSVPSGVPTGVTLTFMHPPGMPIRGYRATVYSPDGTLISSWVIPPSQVETGTATWPLFQWHGPTQGMYSLGIEVSPPLEAGKGGGSPEPIDVAYGTGGASGSGTLLVGGKPYPGTLALTTHFGVGLLPYLARLPSLVLSTEHALPVGLPLATGPTPSHGVTVIAGVLALLGLLSLIALGTLCAIRLDGHSSFWSQ